MAKFLNSEELREWIPHVINDAKKELVIVVPFIKTSKLLYNSLLKANNRGIQTTIVYRENTLNVAERNKLMALENLNLLHHPNVHSKCYMNEMYLIITSMNMYEHSEKNNREMGVLLIEDDEDLDVTGWDYWQTDREAVEEARHEINTILNAATLEKKSRQTVEKGFKMEIIKTQWDLTEELCGRLNKVFENKKFKVVDRNNEPICECTNYYEKIDVYFSHRFELDLKMDKETIISIFNRFKPHYNEFHFESFKYYWNDPKQPIYLYRDHSFDIWVKNDRLEKIRLVKKGIDDLIGFIRKFF